jgi:hypothetical protein
VNVWLHEWEKIYTECKKLKLLDVDKNQLLFDFLNTILSIAPDFTSIWRISIQKKQNSGKKIPDLYKIIKLFCNN